MKKIIRLVGLFIFILGFIYILLPGPTSRDQIPPLPDSRKSVEAGDTTQNPNNVGYYSDHRRSYITAFYYNALQKLDPIGKLFPPLKLNYPPEDAYTYIRDQEKSTFLEEYVYPLRESIFVNGYEPLVKNGRSISHDADFVIVDHVYFNSKTVVRIYPTSIPLRLFFYLGIWASILGLGNVGKKVLKGKEG